MNSIQSQPRHYMVLHNIPTFTTQQAMRNQTCIGQKPDSGPLLPLQEYLGLPMCTVCHTPQPPRFFCANIWTFDYKFRQRSIAVLDSQITGFPLKD